MLFSTFARGIFDMDLQFNHIGNDRARALADYLRNNSGARLVLTDNGLTSDFAQTLKNENVPGLTGGRQ